MCASSIPPSSRSARVQKMRGGLTEAEYGTEIGYVKETLGNLAATEARWDEYLKARVWWSGLTSK